MLQKLTSQVKIIHSAQSIKGLYMMYNEISK